MSAAPNGVPFNLSEKYKNNGKRNKLKRRGEIP